MRTINREEHQAAVQEIRRSKGDPLVAAFRVFLRYQAEELEESLAQAPDSQALQALAYQYQAVCRLIGVIEKPPAQPKEAQQLSV